MIGEMPGNVLQLHPVRVLVHVADDFIGKPLLLGIQETLLVLPRHLHQKPQCQRSQEVLSIRGAIGVLQANGLQCGTEKLRSAKIQNNGVVRKTIRLRLQKEVKQPRIRRQHRQKITKENLAPDMNAHHLKISGATAVNRITGKRLSDIALPLMYCDAVIRAVTQCVIIASVSEIQEKEVLPVIDLMGI